MKLIVVLLSFVYCLNAFAVSEKQLAPNFKLLAMTNYRTGTPVTLSQYRGRVVYLDFWASWCGPCKRALPTMNRLWKKYRHRGFEVIAINLDKDLDEAIAFLNEYPVDYPILSDREGRVPEMYDLKGLPTAFLIDRRGVVRHVHEGFRKRDIDDLDAMIEQMVSQ